MKKALSFLLAALLAVSLFSMSAGAVTVADTNRENYDVLSHYSQAVYDFDNGLPTSGVNDILQTQNGYIWAASYDGLIRYDGTRFTVFSPETDPVFDSFSINALFEDSAGRLWVGSNEKGALVYENNVFTKIASDPLAVEAFAEAPGGAIFLGAREGVHTVSDGKTAVPLDGAAAASVQDMIVDKAGRLWVVDGESKLVVPDGVSAKFDRGAPYSSVFEDGAGNVYIGGEAGEVVRLSPSGDDYTAKKIETGLFRIHSFCETKGGVIWMCSDSGLGYLDGDTFRLAGGAAFYSSLETIMEDHEGSLWVASSRNGLLELVPGFMQDLFFAANIPANIVNSAVEYDGCTYIATDDRLIVLDKNYERVENSVTELLLNTARTRCLTVDSKDNLWLATYETFGAVRYAKDGTITQFNEDSGLTSNKTRVVMEAKNGDIIVGTSDGLNIIRGDKVAETYGAAQGLANTTILSLAEDAGGRIYAGTDGGGIYRLENGVLTQLDIGALDSNIILRMYRDEAADAFWVSAGPYLYHYTGGQLTKLDDISRQVGQVFDIVPDKNGKLWLLASRGIVCGTPEALVANNGITVMNKKDGLPYQTTANSWNRIDAAGNLFVCGTNGLGLLDTEGSPPPAAAPKVTVEQVIVDNVQRAPGDISLSSAVRRVTFKVVTPHFSPKSDITVEYQLVNFDDGWQSQPAESLGDITYTNLHGGDYTFLVRAQNGDAVYTPEVQIQVHKEPTLTERPLFWVLAAVLVLALVAAAAMLVIHMRTVKLLKRQQEYKRITDQTIATISNAIDAKDQYTEGHSERVSAYSVEIGRRMGMSEEELEKLRYVALLHDIGKIGITDTILNKPGRLTDDEFSVMRSHTTIGGQILKDFTSIDNISEGAAAHHEKYNGTGYPNGLKGDEISLTARIIGVCDTYDAMATRRSYKDPMTKDYMIEELTRCSGTQFDPAVAAIMIQMVREGFLEKTGSTAAEAGGDKDKKEGKDGEKAG